jgi:hypothetical protein
MITKLRSLFVIPALLVCVHQAAAQGTAFTYQGQLLFNGSPANGNYDFKMQVYDADTGGNVIVGPITNTAVAVSNGLFTMLVDFGPGAFLGGSNWLHLLVQTNGGNNFVSLLPRQQLTPAPYAIFANMSSNLSGTVSAAQLNGPLGNSQLANSSVTINAGTGLGGGGAVALGDSTTLHNTGVLSVSGNADITASTAGGAVTLGDSATNADTVSTIVKRDGSGNFSAGSITLDGNLNLPVSSNGLGVIYSGPYTLLHTTGTQSTFLGQLAGNLTESNNGNTGIGTYALFSISAAGQNTAVGAYALYADTNGSFNTACGNLALQNNLGGSYNTGTGAGALQHNLGGSSNTAAGAGALYLNTSGSNNTANGVQALRDNTSGSYNTANGLNALYNNTLGYYNTANGYLALYSNTNGSANTANSQGALYSNTSGSDNTAEGVNALYNNTIGNGNTALGYLAGYYITGTNNIDIGNYGESGETGIIRLGDPNFQTTTYLAGNVYATSFNPTSDRNAKENFQPVDNQAVLAKVASLPVTQWNFKTESRDVQHIGPMAQDFQAAFQLSADDKHISVVDEGGVALAAIQGLNQKLDEKDAEIQELREKAAKVNSLEKRLNALEQLVQTLTEKK